MELMPAKKEEQVLVCHLSAAVLILFVKKTINFDEKVRNLL